MKVLIVGGVGCNKRLQEMMQVRSSSSSSSSSSSDTAPLLISIMVDVVIVVLEATTGHSTVTSDTAT